MSILTTIPEELLAAAAQLQGVSSSLTAQNAGAAAPTTTIAPAASDQVSALQAALFASYGTLYQQIAAEAQAIQQQFVQNLGLSSGNYATAEAANAAQATPAEQFQTFVNGVATFLGGPTTSVGGNPFSPSGNSANVISYEIGNWASASSDCIGMAGGGLVPTDWWPTAAGDAAAATTTNADQRAGAGDDHHAARAPARGMQVPLQLADQQHWKADPAAVPAPAHTHRPTVWLHRLVHAHLRYMRWGAGRTPPVCAWRR